MHRTRHGAGRILAMRDGNDAGPFNQPHGRLQAHEAIQAGRADDGTISFGADTERCEASGNSDACATRRATRVAVQCVGIAGLATHTAPATNAMRAAKIRPFAQVGFAKDDGACGAKTGYERRVVAGLEVRQRERTGMRWQAISGGDVGF